MKIYVFRWKEVAPHLPARMFICVAEKRPTAMLLLSCEVPRAGQYYTLDTSGDFDGTTESGADHHFEITEFAIEDGQVILNTA